MQTQHRVALVTGANRGIGLETGKRLAALGYRVIVTARDAAQGRAAAAAVSAHGDAVCEALDITSEDSVLALRARVIASHGRVDVLVNNAGILIDRGESVTGVPLAKVQRTLDTNVIGTWRMCQAFVPAMIEAGFGRVVNVSSRMGQLENPGTGTVGYRVSKAALNSLTAVLAAEISQGGARDVKVNCCHPGWVRTDMGGPGASLSIEEGADTPVWLATLAADGPHGGFFENRKRIAW